MDTPDHCESSSKSDVKNQTPSDTSKGHHLRPGKIPLPQSRIPGAVQSTRAANSGPLPSTPPTIAAAMCVDDYQAASHPSQLTRNHVTSTTQSVEVEPTTADDTLVKTSTPMSSLGAGRVRQNESTGHRRSDSDRRGSTEAEDPDRSNNNVDTEIDKEENEADVNGDDDRLQSVDRMSVASEKPTTTFIREDPDELLDELKTSGAINQRAEQSERPVSGIAKHRRQRKAADPVQQSTHEDGVTKARHVKQSSGRFCCRLLRLLVYLCIVIICAFLIVMNYAVIARRAAGLLAADEIAVLRGEVAQLRKALAELTDTFGTATSRLEACNENFTCLSSTGGCYAVVTVNKEWVNADLSCKRLHRDAHLVFISDEQEQTAVSRLLDSQPVGDCSGHGSSAGAAFWIGGQRINPLYKSTVVWKTTSATLGGGNDLGERVDEMTYTRWRDGEPDYTFWPGPSPEACISLHRGYDDRWSDAQCIDKYCFICELDI